MEKEIKKKDLLKPPQLEPIGIDEHNWFYIEKKKVVVVSEIFNEDNKYIKTIQITIPKRPLLK